MFPFPVLAALPPGIQSLADVARWNPDAAAEATEGAAALRSEAQIAADCVEEGLEGLARSVFMLGPRGLPAQRCSVLRSLDPLLLSDGATAFDALLPPLQRLLCTWEPALQIEAASVYSTILDRAYAVAVECACRERLERSGAAHHYDTPDGLPPALPWVPDAERIERVILPTILLLADAEPGGATASAASRAAAAAAAAAANSKSIARPADPASGSETAEEAASSWLHPLSLALSVLGATSAATPAVTAAGLQRALAFALHKRDPTGSASSRTAAAKCFGFIAQHMQQQLVQDKLFSPLLSLCSDPNPAVRVCACQQINCVTRAALGVAPSAGSTPSAASSASPSSAASSSFLHRALSEMESLLQRDDSVDVKSAALRAIVDLIDVLPSAARRQRSIPLLKQLCTAASAAAPSGSAASSSSSAGAGAAASSPSSKPMLNMLMRAFGEFLWKVSAELQPSAAATVSSASASPANAAAALSSASVAAASSSAAAAASAASASASSSSDTDGPSALRFFLGFFTRTISAAYSSSVGSAFGALSAMAAGANSAASASASAAAASSSISPDVELRRLAAYQLPALVCICVGGHCGTSGSPVSAAASASSSAPASPTKVYSFVTSHAAATAASSTAATPSFPAFPAAPLSSSLPARTLTLLDGLHALLLRMVSDPDVEVRRTAAASFHALAAHWPSDLLLRHLRDPYLSLMHVGKQGCAVVSAALATLEPVVDLFSANKAEDPLAPMLAELLRCIVAYDAALGLQWRKRLALITQAGLCFPRIFALDPVSLHEKIVPLLFDTMRGSGGYPVKRAAVACVASFIRSFPYAHRRHELAARVTRELCSARTCHLRLLYCDLVLELFHRFSYRWLKRHIFAPFLNQLYRDPVAAVRRRFVDLLPVIKFALKSGSKEDRELWELFKRVVDEMRGEDEPTAAEGTVTVTEGENPSVAPAAALSASAPTPSSSRRPGDSDPYVRAAARVLWSNMYAIEIHSEFDRLNRRKEAEEDALDRMEANMTSNKELSAGSMGATTDLSGSNAASSAAAAEAAKKKTSAFDRRRNHSVIIANTSRDPVAGVVGAAAPLGSPLSPGASVGGGVNGPLSARTMIRAKLALPGAGSGSVGPADSPPNSPGVFAGSAADGAAKFAPRPRTGSVSSVSPAGSPSARPGSSAGGVSGSAGFTPASPSTPTKPATGSPQSVPSLKLRPRSHSVAGTGSGDSSAASLREFQQQQLALRSFGGVREEEEDDETEKSDARKGAGGSGTRQTAATVTPPKATASSSTPTTTVTPPAAAITVVAAASLLPSSSPVLAANPPPTTAPTKGKSTHARRPSTLNLLAVSSVTAASTAQQQSQPLNFSAGSPLSPLHPSAMAAHAGSAAALSSLSPAGPLIHSMAKSPKPRDRDGAVAGALSSSSPLSIVPSLLLPSSPSPAAASSAVAQSARSDRSSIISALLRNHSQETANASHAAPMSARLFGTAAAGERGNHSHSAFANEPLSAPAHVSPMMSPGSLSGGPQSMGLAGSRIRTHGPNPNSLSARVAAMAAEEKGPLFPKVSGASAVVQGGSSGSELMFGMSPRVQRMNLHSASGSHAGATPSPSSAAPRSPAAVSSFSPTSPGVRPRAAAASPVSPSPSPPTAASPAASSLHGSPSASASAAAAPRAKRSMLIRSAAPVSAPSV